MNTLTKLESVIVAVLITGLMTVGIVVGLNLAGNNIGGTYLSSCCLLSLIIGIGLGWFIIWLFRKG